MPPALTPWPASRYDQDEVCAAPVHLAAHHIVDAQEHDSLTAQRHLRNQCELLSDGRENYTRAARECAPTFRYFIHAGARDPTGRAIFFRVAGDAIVVAAPPDEVVAEPLALGALLAALAACLPAHQWVYVVARIAFAREPPDNTPAWEKKLGGGAGAGRSLKLF